MAMQIIAPNLTAAVDATARVPLGTIVEDELGNEYIYLGGVASTVAGSFVVFSVGTFLTTLTVAASAGRCAVAMAAILVNQFGWYCVKGVCPCVTAAATVANAAVFIVAASPGQVDDAVVATDRIENAYFVGTATPAGTVNIVYPQAIGLG